jgi:DNA-binding transcriptional MerR regulator
MLTPKQICETLTIPSSTLRRWANRFEEYLSLENHERGTHREYTVEDLSIFKTIQTHLNDGLAYAQIEKRLNVVEEPEPSTALLTLPEFQNAIEQARSTIASMQTEIEELNNWKIEFNKWASLPWWKRIFTTPPNAPERPTND